MVRDATREGTGEGNWPCLASLAVGAHHGRHWAYKGPGAACRPCVGLTLNSLVSLLASYFIPQNLVGLVLIFESRYAQPHKSFQSTGESVRAGLSPLRAPTAVNVMLGDFAAQVKHDRSHSNLVNPDSDEKSNG